MEFGPLFKGLTLAGALALTPAGLANAEMSKQAPAPAPVGPSAAPEAAPAALLGGPPVIAVQAAPPVQPTPPTPRVGAAPPTPPVHRVQGDQVQLRGLAAIVLVTPEARTDVAVSIVNNGPLPDPQVRRQGARVVIEGEVRRTGQCRIHNGAFSVNVRNRGWVSETQLPTIELRVPEDVELSSEGAVRMWIGDAKSARISSIGCGEIDLSSVDDDADIAMTGGGGIVRLHQAGRASVRLAGGGDVELGVVRRGLALSIAGGGDVRAARVDGPTNIALQGGGDVVIRDGRAEALSVAIAGEGDVNHQGVADTLDVVVLGGGDVNVRRVEGQVSRRVLGGGDVTIGQ